MAQQLALQILRGALDREPHDDGRAAGVSVDVVRSHVGVQLGYGYSPERQRQLLGHHLAKRRSRALPYFNSSGEQDDTAVGVHFDRRG